MLDLQHRTTPEVLQNITVPTLIIPSKHDKSVPFEHAEYAATHIKHAELFAAETWGHLLWIGTVAQEVEQKMIEFLRGMNNLTK